MGVTILVKWAMNTCAAIFSRDTRATGQIGGVAYLPFIAVLIAKARGPRLADAKAVTVLASATGIIGAATADVVAAIAEKSGGAFAILHAVYSAFFSFAAV